MKNKKILLALILMCTTTPLNITNAMESKKDNNNITNTNNDKISNNKNNNISTKNSNKNDEVVLNNKNNNPLTNLNDQSEFIKKLGEPKKNNKKSTLNYDDKLNDKINELTKIKNSLGEIYNKYQLIENINIKDNDTKYNASYDFKKIKNELNDIKKNIRKVYIINKKNNNKDIDISIICLLIKLEKIRFLLIAKEIEILIEKAEQKTNMISTYNSEIKKEFEEQTKKIFNKYHVLKDIYKLYVEKKYTAQNKTKNLTILVNLKKTQLENKIKEIETLKQKLFQKNIKTYKNNNISEEEINEIINLAKNGKIHEKIIVENDFNVMNNQNSEDENLKNKVNKLINLEKKFNEIYKSVILLQDENISLDKLKDKKKRICGILKKNIFPKINEIKKLNENIFNQEIDNYINYFEIVAQKIHTLALIKEFEIDLKDTKQNIKSIKNRNSESTKKYNNEIKKINKKIKDLNTINPEVYKENVKNSKEKNEPTDLNKKLTKLIKYKRNKFIEIVKFIRNSVNTYKTYKKNFTNNETKNNNENINNKNLEDYNKIINYNVINNNNNINMNVNDDKFKKLQDIEKYIQILNNANEILTEKYKTAGSNYKVTANKIIDKTETWRLEQHIKYYKDKTKEIVLNANNFPEERLREILRKFYEFLRRNIDGIKHNTKQYEYNSVTNQEIRLKLLLFHFKVFYILVDILKNEYYFPRKDIILMYIEKMTKNDNLIKIENDYLCNFAKQMNSVKDLPKSEEEKKQYKKFVDIYNAILNTANKYKFNEFLLISPMIKSFLLEK